MSTTTETKSRKGIGGPKTPEGKERIRLNALKMGMHANSLAGMQAVSDVMDVSFDEIHQQMIGYYKPADPIEEALIRRIARCTWKLRVIETIEDQALERLQLQYAPGSSLESLSVIERRTDVQLHRAIAALTAKRRDDQQKAFSPAARPAIPSCPPCPSLLQNDQQEKVKNKLTEARTDGRPAPSCSASSCLSCPSMLDCAHQGSTRAPSPTAPPQDQQSAIRNPRSEMTHGPSEHRPHPPIMELES